MKLTTPALAPSPYSAPALPRVISMLSTSVIGNWLRSTTSAPSGPVNGPVRSAIGARSAGADSGALSTRGPGAALGAMLAAADGETSMAACGGATEAAVGGAASGDGAAAPGAGVLGASSLGGAADG